MVYFLKINVAIALFYAFYRLFFYKDTFFGWRRTALLCFFAVSVVVPLLDIQNWIEQQEPMAAMADLYASVVLPEITPAIQEGTDWKQLLAGSMRIVYWLVVTLLAARFLIQLAGIIRLARCCPTQKIDETTVHLLPDAEGPFSFFQWIFVCPDAHTDEELKEILAHEKTHACQWHSIDVLVGELACIFCWFNPFVWLMKREIRTNLEYLADEKVLETGHDSRTYQYHLLGLAHQKSAGTLYNSFNVLPLKRRIMMMNKRRTRAIGRTKYVMFLPLAALLMVVSNIEAVARATQKITTEVIEAVTPAESQLKAPTVPTPQKPDAVPPSLKSNGKVNYKGKVVDKYGQPIEGVQIVTLSQDKSVGYRLLKERSQVDGTFVFEAAPDDRIGFFHVTSQGTYIESVNPEEWSLSREKIIVMDDEPTPMFREKEKDSTEEDIFEVVEKMPRFKGGTTALMQYLSKNIHYPTTAMEAGRQGRVTVQFIVTKDGNIEQVKILRGVSPELDAEAIRVISSMPKWIPGEQRGKRVNVKYTVPVMFRLQ